MEEQDYYKLIDDYIMARLSKKESMAFENALRQDDALMREYLLQKDILSGLRAYGNQELRAKFKGFQERLNKEHETQKIKPPTKIRSLNRWLAAAAAVVLLLAAGFWLISSSTLSPTELYAQNYETYEVPLTSRSEASGDFATAVDRFTNKNYAAAIPLLLAAVDAAEQKNIVHMAIGVSYMEMEQFEKANEQFEIIIADEDPFLAEQAQWYSGLSALRLNDLEKAKNAFEVLANEPNAYKSKEASDILEGL